MRHLVIIAVLILTLGEAHAQVEGCIFSPQDGGTLYIPIKRPFTFHLNATAGLLPRGNVWEASFEIAGPDWAKIAPTSFTAEWGNTSVDVTITLESDTPTCYNYAPWIFMQDSKKTVGAAYGIGAVFYDPSIIGHPKWTRDTLIFSSLRVGDSTSIGLTVYFDSFAVFRSFQASDVQPPFYIFDTIPMSYGCVGNSGRVWFRPSKAGTYTDRAYLVDPLTKDTVQLLLIGTSYAAGVSEEAARPLKLYPNPCDRTLTIERPDAEPVRVEIQNLLGEQVYSSRVMDTEASVDCAGLQDGVYVVSVTTGNARVTRKVVVAH